MMYFHKNSIEGLFWQFYHRFAAKTAHLKGLFADIPSQ